MIKNIICLPLYCPDLLCYQVQRRGNSRGLWVKPKNYENMICIKNSDGDPFISRKRILIHIPQGLDSILIIIKHFLSALEISEHFVLLIRTSGEYLRRY